VTSLPVSEIGKPLHARGVLDEISVLQDGQAVAATAIARERSVFANVHVPASHPGAVSRRTG
jgi:hypothetical protein